MLEKEILDALKAPFPVDEIKFKIQAKSADNQTGLIVAYIDARAVMDRLDEVVGADWSDSYYTVEIAGKSGVACVLTVAGVSRSDVGDPESDGMDNSLKSAYSDAFKRAAVKFGIGRFLYTLPRMWAKIEPVGKSYKIADAEVKRLRAGVESHLANQKVTEVMGENRRTWSFDKMDAVIAEYGEKLALDSYEDVEKILGLSALPEHAGVKTILSWFKHFASSDKETFALKAADANDAYIKARKGAK